MGRLRAWSWVAFGAGVVAVFAAFLPWAKVLFVSASGIDGGDGWLTAGAGTIAAAIALAVATAKIDKALHVVTLLCGLAVGAIGIVNAADVVSVESDEIFDATIGEGLYLTIAAGAVLVVAAIIAIATPSTAIAAAHAPLPIVGQGWYPDPWRQATWRWWDGQSWTADVR